MEEMERLSVANHGTVGIEYVSESGAFRTAVIRAIPDYGVLLTLNLIQTQALLKVCEQVFENPSEIKKRHTISNQIWAGTGFHFMAPLTEREDLFWFSYGALNCYVSTKRMKIVFKDLKAALEELGGSERYMPERHN